MNLTDSIVQKVSFCGYEIFIKRDDLLHSQFSGNKARKFYYYLLNDFSNIKKLVSHGSCQSNAMYSLSSLCKLKNWEFEYYVDHIPLFLKQNPIGNYKASLQNNMKIYEKPIPDFFCDDTLFIKEGGALKESCFGIEKLADEINFWALKNSIKKLKIFLPSGTGTTALFLQKYLNFEVLTTPCVGDENYLQKQFEMLESKKFPTILKRQKKYHFGKLYKEFYEMYQLLLEETNIEFDLLYDSLGWIIFQSYLKENYDKNYKYIYIHQGGILGNESMKERYEHKFNK